MSNKQTNNGTQKPKKCALTRHLGYIEVREGFEPTTLQEMNLPSYRCSISLLAPFENIWRNESTGDWLFSDKKNELSNAKVQIFIEKSNGT